MNSANKSLNRSRSGGSKTASNPFIHPKGKIRKDSKNYTKIGKSPVVSWLTFHLIEGEQKFAEHPAAVTRRSP